MDTIERYIEEARAVTAAEFGRRHGRLFLLKAPSTTVETWDQDIDFVTSVRAIDDIPEAADLSLDPSFQRSWRVSAIRKRPGNPFPERISVGRARNCDVVLRLSYVSKLHAHLLIGDDGSVGLIDHGSANGTRVNRRECAKANLITLGSGDEIQFGQLTVLLVDAAELHRRLLAFSRG